MGVRKKVVNEVAELSQDGRDRDKIHYLFFQRLFSIEDVEHYFKGKYSYNEIKAIIKERYKDYYRREIVSGR